ncbi:MAG: calcium/sodium antiporter [Pseudomonadota bacterium]
MILAFAGLVAGIVLLVFGGGLLVRGASEIASSLGVSPLVVGLTIVGFGTSSPELIINVFGALKGETDLAFGNVVGSNISNFGLVLGVTALIAPIAIQSQLVKREIPLLILVTSIMTVMALDGLLENSAPMIGRSEGVVLMLLFCVFFYINAMDVFRVESGDPITGEIEDNPLARAPEASRFCWLFVLAGFVLLFFGGELTIRNSVALAERLDISETIIGLFVVAVGTSMPELVTSVVAALRKEADLALGNVVGSNIFNSLIVLPASAVITEVTIPRGGVADLVISWGFVALLLPVFFLSKARLGRAAGAFLLLAYLSYVVLRILFETSAAG